MFKKYLKIIFLTLFCFSAFAQELTKDNIKQIRTVQGLLISDPENGYRIAKQIATSKNEIFHLFGSYYIANYHYNKSDYRTAKKILIGLLNFLEKNEKTSLNKRYLDLKGMCLNKLFYIHKNLGEYSQALFYLDKFKKDILPNRFDEHYGIAKIALGDYANGIAHIVLDTESPFSENLIKETKIVEMFDTCIEMLTKAYDSFDKEDKHLVSGLFAKDKNLDEININANKLVSGLIKKNPDSVEQSLHLLSVIRKLERVGDQTLNIAEEIVFFIEAKVLKHSRPKKKEIE